MAYKIRKANDAILGALVAAHNLGQEERVGSAFHADTTQTTSGDYRNPVVADLQVTAPTASDEATAVAMVNDVKAVLNQHYADTLAHDSAVSAAIATADATDEASAITLANAIKADFNTHLSESNVHFNNDGTNTVAATDASNAGTLNTLANELKADVNAHIVNATPGAKIELVGP